MSQRERTTPPCNRAPTVILTLSLTVLQILIVDTNPPNKIVFFYPNPLNYCFCDALKFRLRSMFCSSFGCFRCLEVLPLVFRSIADHRS